MTNNNMGRCEHPDCDAPATHYLGLAEFCQHHWEVSER